MAVLCVLQFFFMPESTFIRGQIVHDPVTGGSSGSQTDDKPAATEIENAEGPQVPLRGYTAGLRIFSGVYKTKSNALTLLARPMMMLFTPIVRLRFFLASFFYTTLTS